jgi:gamma-glutamylcyclotransferase (GGCT)/AIG2-like uncharacterized protein YtfP
MTRVRGRLGADMRARLRLEGTSLGAATTAGRLLALGDYPGLISGATPGDVVHGELFKLDRPDDVLAWLDAYEGVSGELGTDSEYARVRAQVLRASGEEIAAWIYVYRGDVSRASAIAGGRWDG